MTVTPTSFPLRGRIRLNQLLNNVRVNRNTKFKRLELLPFESVFQIQSKNLTSPTDNGHCQENLPVYTVLSRIFCSEGGRGESILKKIFEPCGSEKKLF